MAPGLMENFPSLIASLIASTRALSITGTFSMAWSCAERDVIFTLSCAADLVAGDPVSTPTLPCFEPRAAVSFTPELAGDFTEVSIFKVGPFVLRIVFRRCYCWCIDDPLAIIPFMVKDNGSNWRNFRGECMFYQANLLISHSSAGSPSRRFRAHPPNAHPPEFALFSRMAHGFLDNP